MAGVLTTNARERLSNTKTDFLDKFASVVAARLVTLCRSVKRGSIVSCFSHRVVKSSHVCAQDSRRVRGPWREASLPLKWLDSFSMRNFTNASVFDDTVPVADGWMER